MDSKNQFYIFCLCLAIGFVGGLLYEPFSFIRKVFKKQTRLCQSIRFIADILYCLTCTVFCIFSAFWLHFPNFRLYMILGYAIGLIIYSKILHRTLAIFEKVCYNIIVKVAKKAKIKKKLSKRGGNNI